MTASRPTPTPTRSPWDRWGWVVAALWLVFLVYPVNATLESDVAAPVRGLALVLIAAFAAIYLLGFGAWRDHALKVWFAMLLLALGTVPVIGVGAVGLTPYLGAFSALMVPAPWWKGTTVVSALLPAALPVRR